MFGNNTIVGQAYFKDAKEESLFVTSMFMTLQGEGPYRGKPAFFIRLAKCNLACSFCDTFFDDGDWMTFDEIEDEIHEVIYNYFATQAGCEKKMAYFNDVVPEYARHWNDPAGYESKRREMVLVITGGEPMLQKNLGPFLERMEQIFENTQIESNGTLVQDIPESTTLVVSPKCSERHGKPTKYLAPKDDMLKRADCLKFVLCADPDSLYYTVPDWVHEWKNETDKEVFISPMNIYNEEPQKSKDLRAKTNQIDMGTRSTVDEVISFWEPGLLNLEENRKNHEYTAKYCIQHGFTFNMQQHLFASLA